jgi:hypothetical protein
MPGLYGGGGQRCAFDQRMPQHTTISSPYDLTAFPIATVKVAPSIVSSLLKLHYNNPKVTLQLFPRT